jgi:hypothetical protein
VGLMTVTTLSDRCIFGAVTLDVLLSSPSTTSNIILMSTGKVIPTKRLLGDRGLKAVLLREAIGEAGRRSMSCKDTLLKFLLMLNHMLLSTLSSES